MGIHALDSANGEGLEHPPSSEQPRSHDAQRHHAGVSALALFPPRAACPALGSWSQHSGWAQWPPAAWLQAHGRVEHTRQPRHLLKPATCETWLNSLVQGYLGRVGCSCILKATKGLRNRHYPAAAQALHPKKPSQTSFTRVRACPHPLHHLLNASTPPTYITRETSKPECLHKHLSLGCTQEGSYKLNF